MGAAALYTLGVIFILVAVAACIVAAVIGSDANSRIVPWLAAAVAILVAFGCIVGAVKSYVAGGRYLTEVSCDSFADQTDYDTKVIITNAFDSGGCFVHFNGQWVPRGQLWAEMRGAG